MPIESALVDDVWVFAPSGEVTLEDFKGMIAKMAATPEFQPGSPTLWDLRSFPIAGIPSAVVKEIVEARREHIERRGQGRTAIVTARDSDYGVARMFQAYAENLDVEFIVFRTWDSAMEWLSGA